MMNNPYIILGVPQDASNQEIIRAVAAAMRERKFSTREIAEARAVLSKPATRLAADFMFPVFQHSSPIGEIVPKVKPSGLTVDKLNPDKYNSL